ncbi:MAG: hypothetical protein AAF065_03095 [Verrucomicrobiota bacterium]
MKKYLALSIICSLPAFTYATVSITGTSLNNVPGIDIGDTVVVLVDTDSNSSAFDLAGLSILDAGLSTTSSSTYTGYSVVSSGTTISFIGNPIYNTAISFELGGGIDNGDKFAFVVFDDSAATTLDGDAFEIYTDSSWVVPLDGDYTFGSSGDFSQLTSSENFSGNGTVVPEPSAYAFISGALGLVWVMLRRRK